MPRYPIAPENAAPDRKATERPTRTDVSPGSANSRTKTTPAIGASVRICRAR